jgi:hypothetical protein
VAANPHRDRGLHPLHLTAADKQAVIAFLRALSGTVDDGSRAAGELTQTGHGQHQDDVQR